MSTENVEVFNKYLGNGVATQFSISFPYQKKEFVKVYLYTAVDDKETLLPTNEYEFIDDVTIKYPVQEGAQPLQEGDILTIQRETELGSNYDFDNQRRLFPAEVMNADDLAFQQIQELSREIKRAVKVNPTATETPEELLQTVYDKLDSATEIAGDAINAANQAQVAADNATAAVESAEETLREVTAYVDSAKIDIEDTKNTAVEEVDIKVTDAKADITSTKDTAISAVEAAVADLGQTVTQAKADVNSAIDEATINISDTSTAAINTINSVKDSATSEINSTVSSAETEITSTKNTAINTINTAVSNAESNISTIVSDAEGSITNIAITEANKAIANVVQEATSTATANVNSYVDGTVKPSLQTYVDQAQADANSAATSMEQAALSATAASGYANNASADAVNAAESATHAATSATDSEHYSEDSRIWAEGADSEVQGLGGVHSSKVWSETAQAVVSGKQDISNLSQTLDSSTTKYPSNAAVKAAIDAKDSLPSQAGNDGKFLTTDGTTASWSKVSGFYNRVHDCILENPYHLNYKIEDGIFTLLPGSVLAYPDGSKVVTETEISGTIPNWNSLYLGIVDGNSISFTSADSFNYGSTKPESFSFLYDFWFDTENKVIKKINEAGTDYEGSCPLPIICCFGAITEQGAVLDRGAGLLCLGAADGDKISSVHKWTVFVPAGIKGLIPNGIKADGSFDNIEYVTPFVFKEIESRTLYRIAAYYGEEKPIKKIHFAITNSGEIDISNRGYKVDRNNYLINLDTGNIVMGFVLGFVVPAYDINYEADGSNRVFTDGVAHIKGTLDLQYPTNIIYWDD